MSLVFSAIVPHSPLFIPSIGSEHAGALRVTTKALETITAALAAARPDTLICLTSHAATAAEAVTFNIRPTYQMNFEEFGEYSTRATVAGDPGFAHHLKRRFDSERPSTPVVVTSQEILDYGVTIPLFYFLRTLPTLRVIPIGDTLRTYRQQLRIGHRLRRPIYQEHRRVAVVASANLSHRLNELSPAGVSPKAKAFDRRVLEAIAKNRPSSLTRFRPETLAEVQECGLRPILLLFGILEGTAITPELLSYEGPFGIGHAAVLLRL